MRRHRRCAAAPFCRRRRWTAPSQSRAPRRSRSRASPTCLLHPGEPLRLQRQARHLSRHQADLLGGRQSVPSPPGHQQAAARLAAAGDHHRARAVVDARPRATPTSCCRRPRRSSATTSAAPRATAYVLAMQQAIDPVGEARNDFAIFSALARAARLRAETFTARPRRDGLAAAPLRAGARRRAARMTWRCRTSSTFWAEGYLELPPPARRIRAVRATSAAIPSTTAEDAVRQDRALLGDDRGLRLRRLPAASDLARAGRMARRRAGRRTIRCISSPASRATACTARWTRGRSAPAARSPAARPIRINPGGRGGARHPRRRRRARVQRARRLPRRRDRRCRRDAARAR